MQLINKLKDFLHLTSIIKKGKAEESEKKVDDLPADYWEIMDYLADELLLIGNSLHVLSEMLSSTNNSTGVDCDQLSSLLQALAERVEKNHYYVGEQINR